MSQSALQSVQPLRATAIGPFYLVMACLLAGIAVLGFSSTVPGDLAAPGFPWLLWVHAAVFTAWLALFVAQPALIMGKSLRWHRRLGWAGAGLAVAMVTLGFIAVMMGLLSGNVPSFYPHGLFLIRGALTLLVFGGLVAAAVRQRRRPEWHKRLILCASIMVVVPGLERAMPLLVFGAYWPFVVDGVVDMIALAGPVHDMIVRRRVHPAYVWGVGTIAAGQVLTDIIAPSPVATALLHVLGTK